MADSKKQEEEPQGIFPAGIKVAGASNQPKQPPWMEMLAGFDGGAFDDASEIVTWRLPTKKEGVWHFRLANTSDDREAIRRRTKQTEIITSVTADGEVKRETKDTVKEDAAIALIVQRSVGWDGPFFILGNGPGGVPKEVHDQITNRTYRSGEQLPCNETGIRLLHPVILAAAEQYLNDLDPFFGNREQRAQLFRDAGRAASVAGEQSVGPNSSRPGADA